MRSASAFSFAAASCFLAIVVNAWKMEKLNVVIRVEIGSNFFLLISVFIPASTIDEMKSL